MYSAAVLWEHGISYHEELLPYLSNPLGNQQVMIQYAMKIKEYDPDFTQAFFEGLEQKAEAENMRLQAKIKEVKEKEKEKENNTRLHTYRYLWPCIRISGYICRL